MIGRLITTPFQVLGRALELRKKVAKSIEILNQMSEEDMENLLAFVKMASADDGDCDDTKGG